MTLLVRRMPDGKVVGAVATLEAAQALSRLQGDVWLYVETEQELTVFDFGYKTGLPKYIMHDGSAMDITEINPRIYNTPVILRSTS